MNLADDEDEEFHYIASGQRALPIPRQISSLALWVAADQISGLSDAAAVSSWTDLSGNGHHLVQASGALQPTYRTNVKNGKPTVRGDGTQYLKAAAFTNNQPVSVMLVVRDNGSTTGHYYFDGDTNSAMVGFLSATLSQSFKLYAGAQVPDSGTNTFLVNTFYIVTAIFNGASGKVRINGVDKATGDVGAQGAAGFTLFAAGNGVAGTIADVAEVIVNNKVYTAGDLALLEAYLAAKYAITLG